MPETLYNVEINPSFKGVDLWLTFSHFGISLNCDINIGESSYLTFFPIFNARLMLFYCLSISAKTGEFHTCSNFNSDDEV